MKPILFNTDMVRAILAGRKTVTRRVVKPQPEKKPIHIPGEKYWLGCFAGDDVCRSINPPYHPGDILYVRETWAPVEGGGYIYRAGFGTDAPLWKPSIHMPCETARIFLRVTDVRVERLQEIDDDGVIAEGLEIGAPFDELWDRTIKPADRTLYGWEANPWVWVIGFGRISKEEALRG